MSDIVGRLRVLENSYGCDSPYVSETGRMAADEIDRLIAEVERLGRCLRIAAGMLSTTGELARRHPDEVLSYIEAAEVADRALDGATNPQHLSTTVEESKQGGRNESHP